MGSPLSPVIANFYMEFFEEEALQTAVNKPSCWFRFVDDTFVIWGHGEEALDGFLTHLNSIHPRIQFTVEKEKDGELAFLDVLVKRKNDGSLGHQVYRKPTHTDRYLNKNSNHHPGQKRAMMKTLVDRALRVCEPEYIEKELRHLDLALQTNGYTVQEVRRALHPRRQPANSKREEPRKKGIAYLPYIRDVTDRIGRLLERHEVKTIFQPTQQLRNMLRSAKDPRDPLTSTGVYRIPCSCGAVYIGTTGRSVNTRLTEHKRNCRLGQYDKSAVAEHALLDGNHEIRYEDTDILATTSHFHARLYREAIEIHKHPDNFNRKEEGLKLSKAWYTPLYNVRPKFTKIRDITVNQPEVPLLGTTQSEVVHSEIQSDDRLLGATQSESMPGANQSEVACSDSQPNVKLLGATQSEVVLSDSQSDVGLHSANQLEATHVHINTAASQTIFAVASGIQESVSTRRHRR
ncbi:uncharacterized protein [Anabrus simplex]|uniref:uncharacterized protein n=1 Tax=Anabrus simplex TaxID=316456 RepID=UPI0035A288F0